MPIMPIVDQTQQQQQNLIRKLNFFVLFHIGGTWQCVCLRNQVMEGGACSVILDAGVGLLGKHFFSQFFSLFNCFGAISKKKTMHDIGRGGMDSPVCLLGQEGERGLLSFSQSLSLPRASKSLLPSPSVCLAPPEKFTHPLQSLASGFRR